MITKKLKVCDIKTYNEAYSASCLGVDYIGLHLITSSDFERISEYKKISAAYRFGAISAKPVLVIKEMNIEDIFCQLIPLSHMQYSYITRALK